jgi:predicted metal-dependent hydrolase
MSTLRTKPTERPEFALGMRLHNEGEYYEAHEAWEDIWRDEEIDEYRLFVQGLIQVTSAFHKLTFQKAPGGASRLLARGLEKLEPYPGDYLGVDLAPFREGAKRCVPLFAEYERDPSGLGSFDRRLVPSLRMLATSPQG